MININGYTSYSYSIIKKEGILENNDDSLLFAGDSYKGARRFVVIDKNFYELNSDKLEKYFLRRGINVNFCKIDAGDKNKSEESYISLFNKLCHYDLKRRSEPIIAIGGGVVTDLAGFVASTYRRGIPHIKVPTTLMGYIDASVGIKTGVNFGPFKNRMGTFEIPAGVILDKTFMKTLDERNFINGIGEIFKLAIILDCTLFEKIEIAGRKLIDNKFQDELGQIILDISINDMISELSQNLYETDLRRKVDFGHTFSLAIESASDYMIMHGEAVAIDVLFSCYLSLKRGFLSSKDFNRVIELYDSMGIPMWTECITVDLLSGGLSERMMHRNGKQLIPLPTSIGRCTFINDLKTTEIYDAIKGIKKFISDFSGKIYFV